MDELRSPDLRINPLTLESSAQMTSAMQNFAVSRELGLIVLDDANDSNPYCLITEGPAQGMVVHFSHDLEPEIRFPGLSAFGQSLRAAVANELDIDDLPHSPLPSFADQTTLTEYLESHLRRDDEDSQFLVCLLLPLLDPRQLAVIDAAATSNNFFIRERVAEFIAANPLKQHSQAAERLSNDPYRQVSRSGKKALSSVNRVEFGG
ncbi:MAG: hypothetical protein BMS9Abin37_2767 [Acidobacteriota bacterium]|nr:MAG: hypothetical protein BMS9Abin37_2767 [Acidobacteriota bacterium]